MQHIALGLIVIMIFCLAANNHHDIHEVDRIMSSQGYNDYKLIDHQSMLNHLHCDKSRSKATKIVLNGRPAMICSGHFYGGAIVTSL